MRQERWRPPRCKRLKCPALRRVRPVRFAGCQSQFHTPAIVSPIPTTPVIVNPPELNHDKQTSRKIGLEGCLMLGSELVGSHGARFVIVNGVFLCSCMKIGYFFTQIVSHRLPFSASSDSCAAGGGGDVQISLVLGRTRSSHRPLPRWIEPGSSS